jgi:stage V sporulation protein G
MPDNSYVVDADIWAEAIAYYIADSVEKIKEKKLPWNEEQENRINRLNEIYGLCKDGGDVVLSKEQMLIAQSAFADYKNDKENATMQNGRFDARIYPLDKPMGRVVAFASVSYAEAVVIRNIRIIDGDNGLFVSLPATKGKDGKYYDTVKPQNDEIRKELSDAVLDAFQNGGRPETEQDGARKDKPNDMQIRTKIYPIDKPKGKTVAFANVTIDNALTINSVSIIESEEKGTLIAMPSVKGKDDKYHNIAYPMNNALRDRIYKTLSREWAQMDKGAEKAAGKQPDAKESDSPGVFSRMNAAKAESEKMAAAAAVAQGARSADKIAQAI